MSFIPLLMFPLLALAGLVVILFVGRRRRNSRGQYILPAPSNPEVPIFYGTKRK